MNNFRSRRGFTLVELLVVIVMIFVLTALTLPVLAKVQALSKTTKCSANLRGLGAAALLYAGEHEMTLPVSSHQLEFGGVSWTVTLREYANGRVVFRCPIDEHPSRPYTYVINDFLTPNPAGIIDQPFDYSRISRIPSPRETLLFAEASRTYANNDHFHFSYYHGTPLPPEIFAGQVAVNRHGGAASYLFADGHLETLTWAETQTRLVQPGSRFLDPSAE